VLHKNPTTLRCRIGKKSGSFSEGLSLSKDGVIYAGVDGTKKYPDYACIAALKDLK
jgi:hypothetical protein